MIARVLLGDVALARSSRPSPSGDRTAAPKPPPPPQWKVNTDALRQRESGRLRDGSSRFRPAAAARRSSGVPRRLLRAPRARSSCARSSRSRTRPRGSGRPCRVRGRPGNVPGRPSRARARRTPSARVLGLPDLERREPRRRFDVVQARALAVAVGRSPCPTGCGDPSPQNSPVSSRTPYHSAAHRSPPEHAQTASGMASATALSTASVACIAGHPYRKHGCGFCAANIEPGPRDDLDRPEVALVRCLARLPRASS